MDKIKILGKNHKKNGTSQHGEWNIWSYKIEGDKWVDSFDDMEVEKEYEGVITPNEQYNDNFKLSKSNQSKVNLDWDEVNKKLDLIIELLKEVLPEDKTDDLPF